MKRYYLLFVLISGIIFHTHANPSVADTNLVKQVYQRLIAYVSPSEIPEGVTWPVPLIFVDTDEVNAYAGLGNNEPRIMFLKGMLEKVCGTNEDYIAFVLGHELSHIILGHVFPKTLRQRKKAKRIGKIVLLDFERHQEFEADSMGVILMARAGYNPEKGILSLKKMMDLGQTIGATWEYLGTNHPSELERLKYISKTKRNYYSNLLAYQNGVYLLQIEQYEIAELIFQDLVTRIPDCAECWANLGYAKLMQYIGYFDTKDLAERNVAYLYLKGFYSRSAFLSNYRGVNSQLWFDAVGALREALRLNPQLVFPYINLGIAYLLSPDGKNVGEAEQYFQKAREIINDDPSITTYEKAIAYINLAGYYATSGAQNAYNSALEIIKNVKQKYRNINTLLTHAFAYNELYFALNGIQSKNEDEIYSLFNQFLSMEPQGSLWWEMIYTQYREWCTKNNFRVKSKTELTKQRSISYFTPVIGIKLKNEFLFLGLPLQKVVVTLKKSFNESPVEVALLRQYNIKEIRFPENGISILGTDKVLMIRILSTNRVPLSLKRKGTGKGAVDLFIGMPIREIYKILGEMDWEVLALKINGKKVKYIFYPEIGLGFRIDKATQKVIEIIITKV